jgi:sulfoacetaldehyde acetyltransferase
MFGIIGSPELRRHRSDDGAEGQVIEQLSDVGSALRMACQAQTEGKTTILEIMVTRELGDPFRRDALSKPVRFLEKNKTYV